jgi:hypothetical protein
MTDRRVRDAHELASVGTTTRSLEPVPRVGTWEVTDHEPCSGTGRLKALTPGEPAPLCPVCEREVTWQLSRLAPAVATDHRDVGKPP